LTGSLNPSSITISGNANVEAIFSINQYTISASASEGGSISPSGLVFVDLGGSQTYTIAANSGYRIAEVSVNGTSIGPVTSYTISNVTGDTLITASFAPANVYFFIDVRSSHGSPTPSASVMAGSNIATSVIGIEGDESHRWICTGYSIDGGTSVPGANYTFVNVQADHTITFNRQEQYYLTVNTPVATATGAGWYNHGIAATASVSGDTITSGSGTRQIFTGWTGDAAGTDTTSNPITMESPKTVTANWRTQYQVTYATSGSVLQLAIPPAEWVDSATPATGKFLESATNPAGNTKSVFLSHNSPAAITGPTAITGTYQTQYLVVFRQNGVTFKGTETIVTVLGDAKTYEQLPGTIWVDSGDSVIFSYSENVGSADVGENFVLLRANATSPLTISEPTTVQGDYELQTSFTLNTILVSAAILSIPPLVVIPVLAVRRRTKRITPIAIGGGSISPSTAQKIERGGSSTVFIIAPNPGYRIADVIIDKSIHLGPVRTYKFLKVNENHTISAIFYEN
jgi:uncharacterized repeat protein (TIGR02543 family)